MLPQMRGILIVNLLPCPVRSAWTCPCCLSTTALTMASRGPLPGWAAEFRPRQKRSKRWGRSSCESPMPVSSTRGAQGYCSAVL